MPLNKISIENNRSFHHLLASRTPSEIRTSSRGRTSSATASGGDGASIEREKISKWADDGETKQRNDLKVEILGKEPIERMLFVTAAAGTNVQRQPKVDSVYFCISHDMVNVIEIF